MYYLIYAEREDDETGEIVNVIEGQDEALEWMNHYFNQYQDSIPQYIDFHWQQIMPALYYDKKPEVSFHPINPIFITNGFSSCCIVPIDHLFNLEGLKTLRVRYTSECFRQDVWTKIVEQHKFETLKINDPHLNEFINAFN